MYVIHRVLLVLSLFFWISTSVLAKDYLVESQKDYNDIVSSLEPGDTVILKEGEWKDFEILFKGQGTEFSPIRLAAQTKGKVILSGQSNLRLAGNYLEVSGLVFRGGHTPTSAVIAFRQNKSELAYHSRVTEVVIDNYNNPDKQESDYWVAMYGRHNRFDHNHLVGKRNKGVTLAVRLNSEQSQQNHHRIDHNYFGYRPTFGSNGGETLRIGTSHYSLSDSFTLVENNVFERTNGEVEIVSVKSGKNTLRGNLFYEAQGTLTLRHGNGNLIEGNVFLGNGVEHTGGIRVINKDQVIRDNYLEGLTGYRFGSGFTVMNGVPDSPINRYHQVDNALIEHNTFIDVAHIHLAAGSDDERSAVPINSVFRDNLIISRGEHQPFATFDDVKGIHSTGNVVNFTPLPSFSRGMTEQSVSLSRSGNGLLYPTNNNIEAGAQRNLRISTKEDVGVSWYPKVPAEVPFDSGVTTRVSGGIKGLLASVESAKSGDTLEIESGHYVVPKLLVLDKVLTLKASETGTVHLSFERSSLFEIADGGSLKLEGVIVSGIDSPDAAGNSVVRTKKWGMTHNYRLLIKDSVFRELDTNHSFHVFVSGKGAFADSIHISNSTFENVTGDVLRLDTEIEDLGIYNAEYVTLENNIFKRVRGAAVKLYRGGTDESTFGPHLTMVNNQLFGVGNGKRNKTGSSIYLHGVQVANVSENLWQDSAPIAVEHTVGEPKTRITNSVFERTPEPQISELRAKGPHTVVLENNQLMGERL